jgi:hypothetical protein
VTIAREMVPGRSDGRGAKRGLTGDRASWRVTSTIGRTGAYRPPRRAGSRALAAPLTFAGQRSDERRVVPQQAPVGDLP